jgi:hypothetical protein
MITVKEFRKGYKKNHTGYVDVIYWELNICCEIIILKDRSNVWFRIPTFFDPETKKMSTMIRWISKEISDAFQEEVREQLGEKFPEALQIPDIREVRKKFKKISKKIRAEKREFAEAKKEG